MNKQQSLALAAAVAFSLALVPAQAASTAIEAVQLDRVIVTPTAHYTTAEWQARAASRGTLVAVVLEPVIVTPTARYTLAQWQQRQAGLAYVAQEPRRTGVQAWLKAVWKHFHFKRTPVEV